MSLSLACSALARFDAGEAPNAEREWLSKDLAVCERLCDLDPGEDAYATRLASASHRLARSLERVDPGRARALLVRALDLRERLAESQPRSSLARAMVALTCVRLGRLDVRLQPSRGRTWFLRACAIQERRAERDPANVDVLHDLAHAHLALARAEDGLSASAAARAYERWLATIDRCVELRPDDEGFALDRVIACLDVAEALEREGSPESEVALRRAVAAARGFAPRSGEGREGPEGEARALHALGAFLLRAGRAAEARACQRGQARAMERAERLGASGAGFELFRARVLAVRGAATEALDALERAVSLGLPDPGEPLRTPDFASLRGSLRFLQLLETAGGLHPEPGA